MFQKPKRKVKVKYSRDYSVIKIKVSGPTGMIQDLHRAYRQITADFLNRRFKDVITVAGYQKD